MADPNIFQGSVGNAWLSHPSGRSSTLLTTTTTNINTTTTTSGKISLIGSEWTTFFASIVNTTVCGFGSLVAVVEEIPKPVDGHRK